jgi:hypothetical protein
LPGPTGVSTSPGAARREVVLCLTPAGVVELLD